MVRKGVTCIFLLFVFSLVCISALDIGGLVGEGMSVSESDANYSSALNEFAGDYSGFENLYSDVEQIVNDSEFSGIAIQTDFDSDSQSILASDFDRLTEKEIQKARKEIKKIQERKLLGKAYSADISFWEKFLDFLKAVKSDITGNVILNENNNVFLDFPDYPSSPGNPEDVAKPKLNFFRRIMNFITGNAIIGIPSWSYDGASEGNFIWGVDYTEEVYDMRHFDLSLGVKEGVNSVVYSKGYYLNEKQGKWEDFNYTGTRVGNTGWLREKGGASLTLSNFSDSDYAIFLGYSCLKADETSGWDCNDGKWVVFVVETGSVYYHGNDDVPPMEYTENKDLNILDIPSLLKQLNISEYDVQPVMHDALIISSKTEFNISVGEISDLNFYIKNLGNRNLTNLSFELDIGEGEIAEIISAELPDSIGVNETKEGRISLLFKEQGSFGFPLFLEPKEEEVDTSDNIIRFKVQVGEKIISKYPEDSRNSDERWNRQINYTVKEPYSYSQFNESSLYVISGVDKIRTIFGGYSEGKSINPTLAVELKPLVVEEAISSYPFFASIFIGGKMLTGDREKIDYFVEITNENTGEKYTTPLMESMYQYYYNPRELIPNFEFCTNYTSRVVVTSENKETVDIKEPEAFNLCDFNKYLAAVSVKRLKKSNGEYVVIGGGFDSEFFNTVRYKIEFTDSKNPSIKYETPEINSSEIAMFKIKDIIPRYIDYTNGEIFYGKVILLDMPELAIGENLSFDEGMYFQWSGWSVRQGLNVGLELKDDKIRVFNHFDVSAFSRKAEVVPWQTTVDFYFLVYPQDYMSEEYVNEILRETDFRVVIRDLSTNKEIYNVLFNGNQLNKVGPYRILYLNHLQTMKQLPNFTYGDMYEVSLKPIDNSDLFDLTYYTGGSFKFIYFDALNLLANNPLLRTRFKYLYNAPRILKVYSNNRIHIDYVPKNMHINENKEVEIYTEEEINSREILINDLPGINPDFWEDSYLPAVQRKYINPKVYLSLDVLPFGQSSIKKTNFNCKIGKYEGICNRDNSKLFFVYFDKVNNFMYTVKLEGAILLKRYRDNPKYFDEIFYDILSEIDRNPVQLGAPYCVSNKFESYDSNPSASTGGSAYGLYFPLEFKSGACVATSAGNDFYINFNSYAPEFDIKLTEAESGEEVYSSKVNGYLSRIYISGNYSTYYTYQIYFNSLNLSEDKHYIAEASSDSSATFLVKPALILKPRNAYNMLLNDYSDYMRKIEELNSTILGPKDYSEMQRNNWHCGYGKYNNIQFGSGDSDLIVSALDSRQGDFFKAGFSVNPKTIPYEGEETSYDELINNTYGERRLMLDSDKFYKFSVWGFNDIYDYYVNAPVNTNTFDTALSGISCVSSSDGAYAITHSGKSLLRLKCKWSNINDLKVYEVQISQVYNKTVSSFGFLDSASQNEFRNYAEIVLGKYLEWYPPTPLLNTNFYTY